MDFGGPGFVIAIIALCYGGWIINNWIRAKHGYELEDEWGGKSTKSDPSSTRKVELLTNENEALKGQITRLEERLSVLERIATDPTRRLEDEFEKLKREDAGK
ncbi:hypothetical protein B5C34_00260 [Pacificimonas flava]|uniref:Uncharacterized protein n=2 Tax=Pacificimonas TaxID=1960290 RepID=A0A219B115_9SPHN|nr:MULTISPECIES: hypothetical protein [Pacificimonas]MBZ6380078.1 hypothetical protein [Pacificimonas aurantium]OWV32042.1 hypothetical protein B5C34_00260 [Pacificimonas flava]